MAYLGDCSLAKAELWGVIHGLRMAADLGMRRIEVEVDSMEIVDIINNCDNMEVHHSEAVREIAQFKRRPWELIFRFINREANQLADWLTKEAIKKNCPFKFLDSLPEELTSLYLADVKGKSLTCTNVTSTRRLLFLFSFWA